MRAIALEKDLARGVLMEIGPARANSYAASLAQAVTPVQRQPEHTEIIKAVRAANKSELFGDNYEATFIVDGKSRKPIVRIVDKQTHEVIREIPAKYLQRLAEDL
jgi:uncharacterized FlaG/YvyC family protein